MGWYGLIGDVKVVGVIIVDPLVSVVVMTVVPVEPSELDGRDEEEMVDTEIDVVI